MKIQLTKRLVLSAKPAANPYEMRDILIKGLLLRVNPSGHKAWVVEWARGRRRTLGALSELTLDDARSAAAVVMAEAMKLGEPTLSTKGRGDLTLDVFINEHYSPWVPDQLKGGKETVDRIRAAFRDLMPRRLSEIDQWVVDRWWTDRLSMVSARTKQPLSKVTVSRDIAALRSALNKAVEWKFLTENPLTKIRQKLVAARKVVRFLADDEEKRLRQTLDERDRKMFAARLSGDAWRVKRAKSRLPPLDPAGYPDHLTPVVLLAMNTGLRKGELLALKWEDVCLTSRMLTVRAENAKSGRERYVPLNNEATDVLVRWKLRGCPGSRVFDVDDIKTAWWSLLRSARIKDLRFHDLRHHFASRLVMRSVDLNTVRELLGHADIKMTLRYAHLAPAHLVDAVSRI